MPQLVRFVLCHAVVGFLIAVLFVGGLLVFDVGHLATIIQKAAEGPLAVAILVIFSALTFSSLQIGMAVMLLAADDPKKGGGGGLGARFLDVFRLPANQPAVVKVTAR